MQGGGSDVQAEVRIRVYNKLTDRESVDLLEKACDAGGLTNGVTLFTDLLGDPLCRIRNYSNYTMLVAQLTGANQIIGLVRVGMKRVSNGSQDDDHTVLAAYILGLRVSPLHRRKGVAVRLVQGAEEWCKGMGVEYAYVATEKENQASVNLFTKKLGYSKFRSPAILVQPVYVKPKRLSQVRIAKLDRFEAELVYRSVFGYREFFPDDIDKIFGSKPHKGTYVALLPSSNREEPCMDNNNNNNNEKIKAEWLLGGGDSNKEKKSWAVLSLWGCNELYKVEVKGLPARMQRLISTWRLIARLMPAGTPTYPNLREPLGFQLMYGIHAQGYDGGHLLRNLCWFAHNLARGAGCEAIATEVAEGDPVRSWVPHWPRISCDEDLLCIKRLYAPHHHHHNDWSMQHSPPSLPLFLDPRDF